MSTFPALPAEGASHLVRTDFASDTAWELVCELARDRYQDGFSATVVPFSDTAFNGASWQAVKASAPADDSGVAVLFIADSVTLSSPEHPILVVDLWDSPGESTFRCIPSQLWSVENNLNLGNMDWHDFADATDDHDIFRGF
jgi:hypothetical protein